MGAMHGHHPAKVTELTCQQHPVHVLGEGAMSQEGTAQPSFPRLLCTVGAHLLVTSTPKDWIIPKAPNKGIVCFYPSIHT